MDGELLKVMAYAAPFLCVVLGFILNTSAASMRAANDRRTTDAEYRAKVLAHMAYVEKRLGSMDETMTETAEFKGQVHSFLGAVDNRLLRIERKLDCELQ